MDNAPAISLVVSTLGRIDTLERLLASLSQQSFTDFEVIVVDQNDNGLLDSLMSRFVADPRFRHARSSRGVSKGRNAGIALARAPIVGFPDDDCWYGENVLRDVQMLFSRYPASQMLIGRTVDEHGQNSIIPALPADKVIVKDDVLFVGNANAVFARATLFQSIGGFDERLGPGATTVFQSAEDADLVARAVAMDAPVQFIVGLTLFHEQVNTEKNYLHRIRTYSLGTGAFFRKNKYTFAIPAKLIAKTLAGIPMRMVRRQPPEIREKLTYVYSLASGYLLWR
jgi:glycosyltransferase involved in cell wall biosynthesis